jgi:GH24 family phage-related lysozyme (muramidase)
MASDYTTNLIKKFEGYTAKPKWDHKQYSVGYSTRWEPGQPYGSREDHEAALAREIGEVSRYIDQNVRVPLTDNQRAALTSFGYNVGEGGIGKLLPDINAGNWDRVGKRMLSFSRAGDNPTALSSRRQEEVGILMGGTPPSVDAPASSYGAKNAVARASGSGSASVPSQPEEQPQMFNLLSALGSSPNLMAGMGKAFGMENMVNAGNQNSVFGSLGAMFGNGGGDSNNSGSGGGNMGEKLAQNAMSAAAGSPDEEKNPQLRKPMDLAMLSKILQQRGMLGTAGGRGLGIG